MKPKRKISAEKFVVVSAQPRTLRIAVFSFMAGAGLAWLALRFFSAPAAPQPLPSAAGAPDVSQMTPAQAATTLGNWEYDHANWAAAIKHYESAIAAGADSPDLHTDLGTAYRYAGNVDKALEEYGIAQRKDPFHQNSLFNQAVVYAEVLRDRPRAIATAREFLRRFPQSQGAESARRLIADLQGDRTEAEKKLDEPLSSPKPNRVHPVSDL